MNNIALAKANVDVTYNVHVHGVHVHGVHGISVFTSHLKLLLDGMVSSSMHPLLAGLPASFIPSIVTVVWHMFKKSFSSEMG